ncbi:radical SAM/SPASM domain-containing protein [Frankia sp. AgPm24]|uniref:radical SAM/SPASM domain-containing protein n=1 Tax=Frankia sp. AgPm24 TaxID=631128 RepID=UPI0020109A0B|nr:radical SAM/SPASM domain-containing protein [Frankia sp. AgPm24]MCK9921233.1 radical SAM/SPASM domain-containing protein [Frankia sp. AgPm24]
MTAVLDRTATLDTVWLEITERCQLGCPHCYASSGPTGGHGTMTATDWCAVIDQAADLGVRLVQIIGGEPTLHPALPDLVDHALDLSLTVEIYSNLVRVPDRLWVTLLRPGVRLATSYYSADPAEHERITGRKGSHALTRETIAVALRRGVPLRVGLIDTGWGHVEGARADLQSLGVPAASITVDRMRRIGRGARGAAFDPDELCGRCGDGRAAILPDGTLAPCVMGRALAGGNVRITPLSDLLAGPQWAAALGSVPRAHHGNGCSPSDGNDCSPASERACTPDFEDAGV